MASVASRLPLDVLRIIFTFIRKSGKNSNNYDYNTRRYLHSCVLVNRSWCRAAVPLLWRNAFYYFKNGNAKLIDTYISCFGYEEYEYLEEEGLVLHRKSYARPVFDYASMLKRLDYDRFCQSVDVWCSELENAPYNSISLMIRALFKMFLTRSVILLHLVLGEWLSRKGTDYRYKRLMEREFKNLLEPVRKLKIQGEFVKDRVLTELKDSCKNLDKLFVYLQNSPPNYFEECESLREFVNKQNHLKSFKVANVLPSSIFSSLSTQSKSLCSIYFWMVDFRNCEDLSWENLSACKNLRKLKFKDCMGFGDNMFEGLTKSHFPKLRLLAIIGDNKNEYGELIIQPDWQAFLDSPNFWDTSTIEEFLKIHQFQSSDQQTLLECQKIIDWGIEQGSVVVLGRWSLASALQKFGQVIRRITLTWTYSDEFYNIYRQYLQIMYKWS
ncbi:12427_t:CDS:2 [Funneliformis geosporum]|uniref:9475_t:CDS:1 n=1 Tax=Funneliformis geosporum TaxID=1117311 RepID=A0A9W4SCP1_9GLOM|nr:9475_t:CDS:2 [Funneliformis geosporum]CAI2164359.1 12427_t:CDS:2 [Funneliformis geosporum]